jgi:hypothetical protein
VEKPTLITGSVFTVNQTVIIRINPWGVVYFAFSRQYAVPILSGYSLSHHEHVCQTLNLCPTPMLLTAFRRAMPKMKIS